MISKLVLLIWSIALIPALALAADPEPQTAAPAAESAQAAPPASATPQPSIPPSQNVTINLINRLVQRGVLTQDDANELIKMAEHDAEVARAQAAAAQQTASAAEVKASAAQAAISQMAVAPAPAEAPAEDDEVRVSYVPEVVKQQLRDEIREEVMAQAREENWAAPRTFPAWVTRFRLFGDLRTRYEGDFFPSGNDNTGAFPNFNAINTGPPFDVTGTQFSPQLNVDQDRHRFRLRLRPGAEVDLGDNFTVGVRIATGENSSPVTTNQSIGLANQAQGGDFSRYAIWLDRAFLKWQVFRELSKEFDPKDVGDPKNVVTRDGLTGDLSITIGRFDNPFFTTSELIWDEDLGFDGTAIQGKFEVVPGVKPFFTLGAFPVFNTDFNFSTNRPDKFASYDKYLFAGQFGTDWRINKEWNLKVAAAYYYFLDIEGKLSSPFVPLTASDAGDTDDSRPAFAQKGNTYFPIRDIIPTVDNNFGTTKQFQYFGLATPFRDVSVTAKLDFNHFDPVHVSLFGDWVKNTAFDNAAIEKIAINNRAPNKPDGSPGNFDGGDTGWLIGVRVGTAALEKRGDWNATVTYRQIESDAVVDGFNDSDFGLGGTNLKGYTISASVALTSHVSLGLRWYSADNISGPTYKNDIVMFDVNAKF